MVYTAESNTVNVAPVFLGREFLGWWFLICSARYFSFKVHNNKQISKQYCSDEYKAP